MLQSQSVARFEVNQDMIFIEDPAEFLRYFPNIRNGDVVVFSSPPKPLLWIF